jgi:primosomal protein N' (replication factor Y)
VLHSSLADGERLAGWRAARDGRAGVVLGTRSAVYTPLRTPGLIVVDEEHDPSFKQHEGFRYHARDVAVMRARRLGIPIILGSATPSLETLQNVTSGRYAELRLPRRARAASEPKIALVDLRTVPAPGGLSAPLLEAMRRHLAQGAQVLVFLNRRGYAPSWFCSRCGWSAQCTRCDARLTYHRSDERLHCHHCGAVRAPPDACPSCGEATRPAGQGTERISESLAACFPEAAIARIDRDSTRRRGSMQSLLDGVKSGATQILVGTQMLTKGHDFPEVAMVAVLNADQGLFGTDFRSAERLAQILVQVAGRAGRAERPGEVWIQSAYPEHPLLQRLIREGYESFARAALDERRSAGWPPFTALAVLRAEAADPRRPSAFLERAATAMRGLARSVTVLGPAPATMARRAGRHRAQIVLQAERRAELQRALTEWLPALDELPEARRVRWAIDVDPLEV